MNRRQLESWLRRYPNLPEAQAPVDIIMATPNREGGMPGGGVVGNPTLGRVLALESNGENALMKALIGGWYDTLTPDQQDIIRLRYWEGQELDYIALAVDVSAETVRRKLNAALNLFLADWC